MRGLIKTARARERSQGDGALCCAARSLAARHAPRAQHDIHANAKGRRQQTCVSKVRRAHIYSKMRSMHS
eukprot:4650429-Pleurochrysis_carterae.AAC.1